MLLVGLALLAGCAVDTSVRERAAQEIIESDLRGYSERLSSDEFEGRKPASRGEQLTVDFLEQEFLSLGLQPVNGGSNRQAVPLVVITATSASYLTVEGHCRSICKFVMRFSKIL